MCAVRFLLPPDRGPVRGAARAAVLAEWMTTWLGEPVRAEVAETYRDLAVEVEAERAELAWAPPAVCARLRGGARSMLTVVRYGESDCAAALVVRRDADLRDLADLAGRRAAWVDPLSTSGHLMALAHLFDHGLDPQTFLGEQRFVGSYRESLGEVARGRADVTSFYVVAEDEAMTMREIRELVGPDAERLALLSKTERAPFDALVVGPGAPPRLEAEILALDQRDFPPAFLLEVCRADRFVRANRDDYARFERFCDALLG